MNALIDLLVGFAIGAVFLFVDRYVLRLALSLLAVMVVYVVLLKLAGHGFQWNLGVALRGALGAFIAAHIRFIWIKIRSGAARRRVD